MIELITILGVALFVVVTLPPILGIVTSYYEYWEKRIRLRGRFKI
jgi:hypothetical protein